jgi:hypothetical protein
MTFIFSLSPQKGKVIAMQHPWIVYGSLAFFLFQVWRIGNLLSRILEALRAGMGGIIRTSLGTSRAVPESPVPKGRFG